MRPPPFDVRPPPFDMGGSLLASSYNSFRRRQRSSKVYNPQEKMRQKT
jgi:hypothetical protein